MNTSSKISKNNNYMSLSKISYGYKINPKWAVDKWLSEPTTLEFMQLWETINNPGFKKDEFIDMCTDALSVGSSPNPGILIEKCNNKSFFVDKDFDGDIYLHKELAIDFASWLSPAFRTFCLMNIKDCDGEKFNFRTEEDYVVSPKSLAQYSQKKALENYKKQIKSYQQLNESNSVSYFLK